MKIKTGNIILTIALLQYAPGAIAKEPVWYQFELIIFSYTNPQYTETESWPDKPGLPDYDNALATITDTPADTSVPPTTPVVTEQDTNNYKRLDDKQLILKKEANAIKRSSLRKLILHTGWIQTMKAKEQSLPVIFKVGDEYTTLVPDPDNIITIAPDNPEPIVQQSTDTDQQDTPPVSTDQDATAINNSTPNYFTAMVPQIVKQLDGTITISIGRYLHVWTDLIYRRPVSGPAVIETDSEYTQLETFRFRDHRRMRSKELHYIDNPAFGILIYALPYKTVIENK